MRKSILNIVFIALLSLSFIACSDDKDQEIVVDFSAVVVGEAPNATVVLTNNTTGANSYTWTFGEGANTPTTNEENPETIIIDKAGSFSITLEAQKGADIKTITKEYTIEGSSAINTFNVKFDYTRTDDYGHYFSVEEGKVYKESELNDEIKEKINFRLVTFKGSSLAYFQSTHDVEGFGENAMPTFIKNYNNEEDLSVEKFNNAVDESAFSSITLDQDAEDAFTMNELPAIILFKTGDDKIGAIKITSYTPYVDAVVKVQKY